MVNDRIADMLTRIRNANQMKYDTVEVLSSKMTLEIANILKTEGYISDYKLNKNSNGDTITLDLKYSEGKKSGMWEYVQSTAMRRETSSASQCVGCGKCEKHCPQGIPIRAMLKEAVRELETPKYRVLKWAVKTFRIY